MMRDGRENACSKLNILMINVPDFWTPNTIGGQEAQILLLVKRLIEEGNGITVVLPKEVSLCEHFRRAGAKVEIVPLRSALSFAYIPKLIRLVRRDGIRLVHTHECRGNLFGFITAKIGRVNHVVTRHEMYLPAWLRGRARKRKSVYMLIDRMLFKWVDRIIAVSERIAEEVTRAQGVDRSKVTTIHVGIDLTRFTSEKRDIRLKKKLDLEGEYFVVGSVGRLVPEKGYEYLLRAARVIHGSERNVKFVIVGNGPDMERLRILAEELDLSGAILFLGRRDDVPELIEIMDVFVLPSLTEGLPLVLLEAMAMRKPVVATDVGGVPEVITHMENGILVAPADSEQLASAVIDLLRDKRLRENLALKAKNTVTDRFYLERMVEETCELYQEVVDNVRVFWRDGVLASQTEGKERTWE